MSEKLPVTSRDARIGQIRKQAGEKWHMIEQSMFGALQEFLVKYEKFPYASHATGLGKKRIRVNQRNGNSQNFPAKIC